MADYKNEPLQISAFSTGGADVDVSATLLINGKASQESDATLVDTHVEERSENLTARSSRGDAVLQLIFVVAPMLGNGEFKTRIRLTHSALSPNPFEFTKAGDSEGNVKTYSKKFRLP